MNGSFWATAEQMRRIASCLTLLHAVRHDRGRSRFMSLIEDRMNVDKVAALISDAIPSPSNCSSTTAKS